MVSGAFCFDQARLELIARTIEGLIKAEVAATYSVKLKNGSSYTVDNISELDRLPLSDVKSRDSFEAKWETTEAPWTSISLILRYWRPAVIDLSVSSPDHADRLHQEITASIESSRQWYGWIFTHWFLPALAVPLYSIIALPTLAFVLERDDFLKIAGACAAYAFVVICVVLMRVYLFDSMVVNIGSEMARQMSLARTRSYLFGTLLVGSLLAILGAAAVSWFQN